MIKIDVTGTEKRKCIVCGHKTGHRAVWSYIDGIRIEVPVCEECQGEIGYCLNTAMSIHLKAIAQSVVMSKIITSDEKKLQEIDKFY